MLFAGLSVTLSANAFEFLGDMDEFPGPPSAPSITDAPPLTPIPAPRKAEVGAASFYWRKLAGRRTASGERFDPDALTMAHPSLPFGTRVRVSLVDSSREAIIRVNDRGPFTGSRIADLSPAAARRLGVPAHGTVTVRLEVVSEAAESPQASSQTDR